jgi:transposase
MSNEIRANYAEQYLFPPSLEDFVPPDHPARFIREFVDSLDLRRMGFKVRESEEGRPNYGADLLLKVWLYGYFESMRSSRKLEKACWQHVGLLWLTGLHYPDHNTLWRFYRDNRRALKGVFVEAVRLAVKGGLVGMVLNAVDGTKIRADVSRESRLHEEKLKELLRRLNESVEEVCDQIEKAEEKEEGKEYRLPDNLKEKERLRDFIREGLEKLEKEGVSHLSLTDKDARMMITGEGIKFAYNAQAVVDANTGVIVGAEVVQEESDNFELVEMLDGVKENVGEVANETVADAGYFSGEELKKAEDSSYEVLVDTTIVEKKGRSECGSASGFEIWDFRYNASTDVWLCPKGGVLKYEREQKHRGKGYVVRVYRCQGYESCVHRGECSQSKKGRTIGVSPYHLAIVNQLEKQNLVGNKALLKRRKTIVEPVFGIIKQVLNFRRWTVRGLENVRAQWFLLCATINLRKIYQRWKSVCPVDMCA